MKNRLNIMSMVVFMYLLLLACSSNLSQDDSNRYKITYESIEGRSAIEMFSIAELKVTENTTEESPGSNEEVQRVTCEVKNEDMIKKKVLFFEPNEGYQWSFTTTSFELVENDSLNNLSFKEKIKYLEAKGKLGDPEKNKYDRIPIEFESGKWYMLWGFEDIEGHYYFYVKEDKSLKVIYRLGPY